jgi:hypothetical protein
MPLSGFDIIIIISGIAILFMLVMSVVLQVWMVLECLIKERDPSKRLFWLLIILLLGLLGSLLYLTIRRPRRKLEGSHGNETFGFEDRFLSRFYRIRVPKGPLDQAGKRTRSNIMTRWNLMNIIAILSILVLVIFMIVILVISLREEILYDQFVENEWFLAFITISIMGPILVVAGAALILDPRRGWNEFYLIGMRKGLLRRELLERGFHEMGNDYFKAFGNRGLHIRIYSVESQWECPIEDLSEIQRLQDIVFVQAFTSGRTSGPAIRIMEYSPIGPLRIPIKFHKTLMDLLKDLGAGMIYDTTFRDPKLVFASEMSPQK